MRDRFLRFVLIDPKAKIVRVKSWWPYWGPHGIEWPTVLYDTSRGMRVTGSPVWDRHMFRGLWGVLWRGRN